MSDRRPQKFNNNKGNGPKSIGVGKRIRDIERLFKVSAESTFVFYHMINQYNITYFGFNN